MLRHVKTRTSALSTALKTCISLAPVLALSIGTAAPTWAQSPAIERGAAALIEDPAPLRLPAALALAMASNAGLAVAQRALDAAEGPLLQGRARPNPALSVLLEDLRAANRITTVQLSQAIELGGKRAARIDAADRLRDIAAIELAGQRAALHSTVLLAFQDVLLAQQQVQGAAETAALARRGSDAASRRVLAGKVSPVEETKARIAEASAGLDTLQAQTELALARQRLTATWGNAAPRFERAEPADEPTADLPALPTPQALAARLAASPSLRRAQSEVLLRQAVTRVERSKATPDVTVSLGLKRDEQAGRNQAVIGFSMPIGVFDRNQGNVLEALKREEKSHAELVAAEQTLRSAVLQAAGRLAAASAEAQAILAQVLPGAQSAFDAASKGFELGKFSFLDVLDAQRTLFQAKAQHLRARGQALRAAADIDRWLGDGESLIAR